MNPSSTASSQPGEKVFDSPTGWVARHIGDYVRTDGEKGHRWHGVDTLLLTIRGRRSGKLRRTALIYRRDGDGYIVGASRGGAKHHPSWYLNLVEHPDVTIQVGSETFAASPNREREGEAGAVATDDLDLAGL